MNNQNYSVDYFINKFNKIPEDKWTTEKYIDPTSGACCALGHCGVRNGFDNPSSKEIPRLVILFREILGVKITDINDGIAPCEHGYGIESSEEKSTQEFITALGTTPRERILVALELIKGFID